MVTKVTKVIISGEMMDRIPWAGTRGNSLGVIMLYLLKLVCITQVYAFVT